MTRQTSFKAGQPGGCRSGHSTGRYADPNPNSKVGGGSTPPLQVSGGGLRRWAYFVVVMTPVIWILLFVFAHAVSTDSMSAFAKPVGILITAVVLLAYSVPTVAVAVLALMVWRRERFWMAFPVTLAFSLQVWAATQVQSPLLLLVTMGVGLAVLLTDSIRQWHPRGATP